MQGRVSQDLALTSFGVTGTRLHFSPTSLPTLRGRVALLKVGFGFALRGERQVHRNHVVRVVHLVRVYG
jgi:hypothetical protein